MSTDHKRARELALAHRAALREANRVRTERPPLTVGERVFVASLFTSVAFILGAALVWGLR